MQPMYSILDDEHLVDLVRVAFAGALEERGYRRVVAGSGPGAPHVTEYRADGAIVSMAVDTTVGEKWQSELTVETEGPPAELEAIITQAVGGLLAEFSDRLVRSVLDPSCRSAVVRALSRVVSTME